MAKEVFKVVVRLLPPEITMEQLEPTFGEAHLPAMMWKSFQAGKRYKGESKPSRNSRCYMQFESLEEAEAFVKDYHGHSIVDGQGETFRAVACFAPYQKVPRLKSQKDPRDGTIEDDATYKEFVEDLSKKKVYVGPDDPRKTREKETTTPLIEHIRQKAKERKERSERRIKDRNQKWKGYMDGITEEPKKSKFKCSECGTARSLEEDPDNRGTFYCTPCWESFETESWEAAPKKSKKKKKDKDKEEYYEESWEEETTSKKKKKKKGKDEDEWWEGYAEDDSEARRKKKKKDKAAEEWGHEEWSESSWKSSGKGESWWKEEGDKKKKKSKYKDSDWWEESSYQAKDSGSKWKAKDESGYEEEKPKKGRKDKKSKEDDASYWAPKSKSR